jgi:hypothetical protein
LKKIFIYAQTFLAHWENPDASKISGSSGIYVPPDNFGQIIWLEQNICFLPTILGALSHMKEIMLTRTRLEILVNMRRYFNHLKSRGHINLLISP